MGLGVFSLPPINSLDCKVIFPPDQSILYHKVGGFLPRGLNSLYQQGFSSPRNKFFGLQSIFFPLFRPPTPQCPFQKEVYYSEKTPSCPPQKRFIIVCGRGDALPRILILLGGRSVQNDIFQRGRRICVAPLSLSGSALAVPAQAPAIGGEFPPHHATDDAIRGLLVVRDAVSHLSLMPFLIYPQPGHPEPRDAARKPVAERPEPTVI